MLGLLLEKSFLTAKRLKWVLALFLYFAFVLSTFGLGLFPLMGIMLLGYILFEADRKRDAVGSDDFNREGMFLRYGYEADHAVFTIPADPSWDDTVAHSFADDLRTRVAGRIRARIPDSSVRRSGPTIVTDRESMRKKAFSCILIKTPQGSTLAYFIHYANFGRGIVAHHSTYVRGTYHWLDVLGFIVLSPLTIWSWGLPWLLNRYSIAAAISELVPDSFDSMDLQTVQTLVQEMLREETLAVLQESGLLTPELEQKVVAVFNNQSFNFKGASGFRIGAISQAAQPQRMHFPELVQ